MALLDDIIQGVTGVGAGQDASIPALGAIGFIFWIVIAIGSIGGGFFVLRYIFLRFSYEGGDEIAPYRFHWMGKYSEVEGNLSHNDSFDEEVMAQLERHSDMKIVVDMVKNEIRNKQLFVYNFKVTDEGNVIDSFSRKVRIISPVDVTLPKYTWMDQQGKRNFGSVIRREKRRNIVIYHTSRKITIYDEDGNEEDWWIISPIPMVDEKLVLKYTSKSLSPTPIHLIDIIKIEGGKAIAELGSFAPTFAESIQKYLTVRSERDNYRELYQIKVEELEDANMMNNNLKHLLHQKPYIPLEQDTETTKSVMNFGWIIGGAVISFIMMKLFPELIKDVDLEVMQIMGLGIGLALTGLMWRFYTESNKTHTEKAQERM